MAATVGALLSAFFRFRGAHHTQEHGAACCEGDLDPHTDKSIGFQRSEMFSKSTKGTVSEYDRHVFVAGGHAHSWAAKSLKEFPLAEKLSGSAPKSVKVTLFEDEPGMTPRVIIFPLFVAIDAAVAEQDPKALLDGTFAQGVEPLTGIYFFVCSHTTRDARCGACGPRLVSAIRRAAAIMGLEAHVFKCSHVGGHDMAGNVLVFYRDPAGKVHGDWYGYVTPDSIVDVMTAARSGDVYDKLWRGSMLAQ